jgi:hypothetical protein
MEDQVAEKTQKMIPPDPKQCQAEKMPPYSFMTFGTPHRVRCTNTPVALVAEAKCAADGLCGAMTLCADCLKVYKEQTKPAERIIAMIEQPTAARKRAGKKGKA